MTGISAEDIIERFGGIRPMAGKLGIPVTTVQGWKKRNLIPAARLPEIQKAAAQNNIEMSDLLDDLRNQPQDFREHLQAEEENAKVGGIGLSKKSFSEADLDAMVEKRLAARMAAMEKKTSSRAMAVNIALLVLAAGAVVALIWPYKEIPKENKQALQSLEKEVGAMKGDLEGIREGQSFLEDLKKDVAEVKQGVEGALAGAQNLSQSLSSGTIEERIAKLEGHIGQNAASSLMSDLLTRYQTLTQSAQGEELLGGVVAQLNGLIPAGEQEEMQTDAALEKAVQENSAIGATFQGVPASDLKAAAMLLAMTQFRSSLGRDGKPFANDLELLLKLSGGSDPALKDSLLKLAPYSEQGILTPRGLTDEFKNITGDIVVASLQGEDVSIEEKAKARLNEVLKIEKNGELLTGTPTQASLAKAENLLNEGNIEAAISEMRNLQGPAALTAAPWIDKAQATLMAQKLKMTISHAINAKAAGGITAGGASFMPGTLIQNKETGINILKRDSFGHDSPYQPR